LNPFSIEEITKYFLSIPTNAEKAFTKSLPVVVILELSSSNAAVSSAESAL